MTKKGRLAALGVILMLFVLVFPGVSHAAETVLKNPGFEEAGDGGAPASWIRDVWVQEQEASPMGLQTEEVHSGASAAYIENVQANHAKWIQTVSVDPDTLYRISGWVKVVSAGAEGTGANIFAAGIAGGYPSTKDTGGNWQLLEFVGKTGAEQKELTIGASFGGYGNLSTGKAYFDDLAIERLDAAPEGANVISLDPGASSGGQSSTAKHDKISPMNLLLFSALFSMFFAWVYTYAMRNNRLMNRTEGVHYRWFLVLMGLGLIVRLWLGWTQVGYMSDMKTFMYWGQRVADLGPGQFYAEGVFADYPPGYLYILYVLSSIQRLLSLDPNSAAEMLLFKLPAILSDLAAAYLLYRFSRKTIGSGIAVALTSLYLFNPAVLMDSAIWGQADAFFVLFLLLSINAVADRKFDRSMIWFAIATLVKPQALIFTPVLLLALIHYRPWKQMLKGAVSGLAVFGILAAPFFWGNGGIAGLIKLYMATLSSYPYSTVNAFNLYMLSAPTWTSIDEKWLGIPYRLWGNLFILVAVAVAAYFSFRKNRKDLSKSHFIAMALIVVMFVAGAKMHERYMFPALLLCLFAFIQSKDRRFLPLFMGFSITQYINVGYVLKHLNAGQNPGSDGIVLLCSITNVALLLYMLYIGYQVYVRERVLPLIPPPDKEEQQRLDRSETEKLRPLRDEQRRGLGLGRKDWVWMSAITAVYAIVALINLGSMKSPETVWQPASGGESFYIDLGETKQLEKVNVFGGVGTGKFKLEFGDAPGAWSSPLEVNEEVGNVFIWKSQPLTAAARYVKLTVDQPGFSLHELAFYAQGGSGPLPVQAVVPEAGGPAKRGEPANLFDEQDLVPAHTSFMNSTYFDEIYHARTAYEHYHDLPAYENTHPPLGKLIIGLGMQLFGVNPFGWRIMGTLFGIAMLPLIYMMAFRLFGRTRYGVLAAGLFAFDFMHFTQTRISTIDVYGVFFIMLMFYFMQRYWTLNFYKTPVRKTLVPLFWSGLFFGIGVASKWIVLYGGAGLAVMLGLSLYERYREYRASRRLLADGGSGDRELAEACKHAVRSFWKNTIITLASCLGFFVLIPGVIYALSYIPMLTAGDQSYTFKALVDAQVHMFDYHSQLVATHPFSSQWWQWPFMKRPVWFYSGSDGLPAGQVSTIVTMGNPLIWWIGIFALLATVWLTFRRKEKSLYMIWIAFFSQYVPWMLVPRETFIYHYFAMVPFIILSIVYIMKLLDGRLPESKSRYIRYGFAALAGLLFILFYPALSGMQVSGNYVTGALRWFPSWLF